MACATAVLNRDRYVFAERGFHRASVEAVADAAGYSTGALYSNFAGKEELFLSLYEERIRRRRGELREAAARSGPAAAAAAVDESLRRDRDFLLLYFEFALHAARTRTSRGASRRSEMKGSPSSRPASRTRWSASECSCGFGPTSWRGWREL